METTKYINSFGLKLYLLNLIIKVLDRLFPNFYLLHRINNIKHKLVKKKLNEICYIANPTSLRKKDISSEFIWVFWWQGEKKYPELIETCFNSIKRNAKGWKVNIISENNLNEFISLPKHIIEKFNTKSITITHLSDIIRFSLLYEYGGLWLDATTFISQIIPSFDKTKYWTTKMHKIEMLCISKARWNGAIMYCPKGHVFPLFMKNCFSLYWKRENMLIDYFLIDYFTDIAYSRLPQFAEELDNLEYNNECVFILSSIMNKKLDSTKLKNLLTTNTFHKLQRRNKYFLTDSNGTETNYSFFQSNYNNKTNIDGKEN